MSELRPLPQDILNRIVANMTPPPPKGDPTPFVAPTDRAPCRYCGEEGGDCNYVCC